MVRGNYRSRPLKAKKWKVSCGFRRDLRHPQVPRIIEEEADVFWEATEACELATQPLGGLLDLPFGLFSLGKSDTILVQKILGLWVDFAGRKLLSQVDGRITVQHARFLDFAKAFDVTRSKEPFSIEVHHGLQDIGRHPDSWALASVQLLSGLNFNLAKHPVDYALVWVTQRTAFVQNVLDPEIYGKFSGNYDECFESIWADVDASQIQCSGKSLQAELDKLLLLELQLRSAPLIDKSRQEALEKCDKKRRRLDNGTQLDT